MKQVCTHLIQELVERISYRTSDLSKPYAVFLDGIAYCKKYGVAIDRELLDCAAFKIFSTACIKRDAESLDIFMNFDQNFDYYKPEDIVKYFGKTYNNSQLQISVLNEKNLFNDFTYSIGNHLSNKFKGTTNISATIIVNHLSSPQVRVDCSMSSDDLLKYITSDNHFFYIHRYNDIFEKLISPLQIQESLLDYLNIKYNYDSLSQEGKEICAQFLHKLNTKWERDNVGKLIGTARHTNTRKI